MRGFLCNKRVVFRIRLKDDLNSFRVKSLFNKIKARRETNRKVLYKERLAGDFLPFKMAESIPAIENYM